MESNDWKAKAYGLAEELKAEVQRGAAASQALRAVVARLCAAVSGLDPALDPHLSRLRDVARGPGEIAAIEAEVTRVADAVLRSGDAPRQAIPNQRLRELLGRMRWPDTLAAEIEAFKEKLADDAAPDAWVEVMEHLTALVAETVRDSTEQVRAAEEFLSELTARLEELDAFMQKGSLLRDQSLAGGRELGRVVRSEVQDIQDTVREATELGQLREDVGRHLAVIELNLGAHIAAEEERHRLAHQTEQALRARLEQLESEAAGLRKEVAVVQELAMVDPVTGLPNRAAWDERLRQEYARWRRFKGQLSLAVFDVDNFKSINDRFGHASGDKALNVIATALRSRVRQTDFIARYGGEEFAVLLIGAGRAASLRVADEMRQAVARAGLHARNRPVEVTISCGVAEFTGDDSPEKVFERADAALYEAKRTGKNRCVLK
jgi:diguanylate cyclase